MDQGWCARMELVRAVGVWPGLFGFRPRSVNGSVDGDNPLDTALFSDEG